MREIKFRGKRADNGQWVCGYYFKTPLTDEATGSKPEDGWFFLTGKERYCISKDGCVYEVITETVSQYTGLKDKNGIEIYDGDILKYKINGFGEKILKVFYKDGIFQTSKSSIRAIYHICEVIGNIYENTELIKEG